MEWNTGGGGSGAGVKVSSHVPENGLVSPPWLASRTASDDAMGRAASGDVASEPQAPKPSVNRTSGRDDARIGDLLKVPPPTQRSSDLGPRTHSVLPLPLAGSDERVLSTASG